MTRSEILQVAKPILFNAEMVRAILDGRKTVTRRVIKVNFKKGEAGYKIVRNAHTGEFCYLEVYDEWESEVRRIGPPYLPGDYLYVRETWSPMYPDEKSNDVVGYMYRADEGMSVSEYDRRYPNGKDYQWPGIWKPSIHMPKEAARIFLRVTDMRVERLQDITEDGARAEGICEEWARSWWKPTYNDPDSGGYPMYRDTFAYDLWDSTIPPKDRNKYGWAANPWVFVIEFERVEVQE